MPNKVNFETREVDGVKRPIPVEPHISTSGVPSRVDKEPTVQAGYARGGTDRPANGVSGEVEQLDNQGRVTKVHPGEVALAVREDGPQAGLDKLGGGLPPGEPEPSGSKRKGSK